MTIVGSLGASAIPGARNPAMPVAQGERPRFAGPVPHRADLDERPTDDSLAPGPGDLQDRRDPKEPSADAVQTKECT